MANAQTRVTPVLQPADETCTATLEQAAAVFNACLGAGYVTVADLRRIVERPRQRLWVATVAGKVVGAATASLLSAEATDRMTAAVNDPVWPEGIVRGPAGLLQSAAVLEPFRRQGTGSQLIADRRSWFEHGGATVMLALARTPAPRRRDVRRPQDTSEGPLRLAGMVPVGTAPRYWAADRSVACSLCRRSCACSATLFAAALR